MRKIIISSLLFIAAIGLSVVEAREFVHPGISYTQGQLDRMKAMVEAKAEPYYTTFQNLLNNEFTRLDRNVKDRGTSIPSGKTQDYIGTDGRCAHDLALIWHITGDRRYADKAVAYLNANNHYTNVGSAGTAALGAGQINLLIEAAELMRDYDGWNPAEQQKFKDMLTYPYYSNTEDVHAKYANGDDSKNGITFYWNIFNGDPGRYGNQGMFGMLGMLAMGIYLDNELIYDRALRYVSGLKHRADDLPYTAGPPLTGTKPNSDSNEYQNVFDSNGGKRSDEIEDYGYDELLANYIYPNGQCQESSRDQAHVLCGLHKYIEFAEIAWNQGDRFYSLLDNRLLKGIEFNYKYNLSYLQSYPDQTEPWEPVGVTSNPDEVTLENEMYLRIKCRSGRWESLKINPRLRANDIPNIGSRESAYAHYTVRAGLDEPATRWLRRTRDYTFEKYGPESINSMPHKYEWNGWGTLTKTLDVWMAGDPVTYADGHRKSGIHTVPGTIPAADYDYYNLCEDGESHTYHKVAAASPSAYRPDGGVTLTQDGDAWVVTDCRDGEWLSYTLASPLADTYDVVVKVKAPSGIVLGAAVSGGEPVYATVNGCEDYAELTIPQVAFPAGACVLRLYVKGDAKDAYISEIRIRHNTTLEKKVDFTGELNNKDKVFEMNWSYAGMLPERIDLLRSATSDVADAEVISEDNRLGEFTDASIEAGIPAYTYWLRVKTADETYLSEPVGMEWGHLDDSFADRESCEWAVPGNNGTVDFLNGHMEITPTSGGLARLGRNWSFPFHAGNYPILAFCMEIPENVETALYTGANSWNNGFNTFTGKYGDIVYYDLSAGSFQNSKGEPKTELDATEMKSLPLQLRFRGAGVSDKITMHWVKTFRSIEDMKNSGIIGIVGSGSYSDNAAPIFNSTGISCGTDPSTLPPGLYISKGKKFIIH